MPPANVVPSRLEYQRAETIVVGCARPNDRCWGSGPVMLIVSFVESDHKACRYAAGVASTVIWPRSVGVHGYKMAEHKPAI
jgi:hypothetical protein